MKSLLPMGEAFVFTLLLMISIAARAQPEMPVEAASSSYASASLASSNRVVMTPRITPVMSLFAASRPDVTRSACRPAAALAHVMAHKTAPEGAAPDASAIVLRASHAVPVLPNVTAMTVTLRSEEIRTELVGRIVPHRVAEVRARRDGVVVRRHFCDGCQVRVGQRLFDLDSRETIRAPMGGRIGRASAGEGDRVLGNDPAPLAVIEQLDPVAVEMRQLPAAAQWRELVAGGGLQRRDAGVLDVQVSVTRATGFTHAGRMVFDDVRVDADTGHLVMRASVANPGTLLLPGMVVRVRALLGVDAAAVMVPLRAVRRGADGTASVLVLDAQDITERRVVVLGTRHANTWYVREGLLAGERVVVDGAHAVNAGVRVRVLDRNGVPGGPRLRPMAMGWMEAASES